MKKISLCFILSALFFSVRAQAPQAFPDTLKNLSGARVLQLIEIGVSANAYRGDLAQYDRWTSAFHLALKFNKARLINHRVELSAGFLTGENREYTFSSEAFPQTSPNTFFRTNFFSFSYELQVNLYKSRQLMVYLSQGLGLFRFTTEDEFGESLIDQINTRPETESYNNFSFYLPTGLGASYLFRNGYGLGVQAFILNTQTDFLDNISEWGVQSGNDNALRLKISFLVPLKKKAPRKLPPVLEPIGDYSHDRYH